MAERGRPRSEQARLAILTAASELIDESGYEQLTVQGVAARAGTGRQTVYRWWASKAMIVAELVIEGRLQLPSAALPDSGSLGEDLADWLDQVLGSLADPRTRSVLRGLVTAASDDEAEGALLYETSTGPFRRVLIGRLERGADLGQIGPSGDPAAIAEALIGTVLLRTLTPGPHPVPVRTVVRTLLGAAAP